MTSKTKTKCVFEKQVVLLLVSTGRLFSVKNVFLSYKSVRPSNSGCTWIVGRALRLRLEHLLRYLLALPTIQVHSELDGRTLDIVRSFKRYYGQNCTFSLHFFEAEVLSTYHAKFYLNFEREVRLFWPCFLNLAVRHNRACQKWVG